MSDEARSLHLEKRDGAARCAYCHDPLTDHAGVTCEGCGTRLHDDCVVEARCPTLGCQRTFAGVRPRETAPPPRSRASFTALVTGVLLPVICFVVNEANGAGAYVPEWKYDRLWSWLGQFRSPGVQRPFYPLLVWSVLAFFAASHGQRGRWIRVGLRGGVALAALFSVMYLRALPESFIGLLFFGLGILGLAPYLALYAYGRAARHEAQDATADPKAPADEATAYLPWAIWSVLGVTATALAIQRMNARWAALPTEDPTCFVLGAPATQGRVHPTAVVAPSARLAPDVDVGPYAVIEDDVVVGAGTRIGAHAVLGEGAVVGEQCTLHPRVTLYARARLGDRVILHAGVVVGGDGFGYVQADGRHVKFPQAGTVVLEDDVEVGCNTTIDRGSLGETRVGRGTKLDNLVQVAHDVRIGPHCVIAAQTGIAGSATVGAYVAMGGQAGVADHVTIEDAVMIGCQAGVITGKTVRAHTVVWGTPARPLAEWKKAHAAFTQLPRLRERPRELARQPQGSGEL